MLVLATLAFVPELGPRAREAVLRQVLRSESSVQERFAGLFALRMKGAHEACAEIAGTLLAAQGTPRELRVGALECLEGPSSEEVQARLRSMVDREPEVLVTSAAYRALCRSGSPATLSEVLARAAGGDGFAREGLEACRDASLVAALDDLVRRAPREGEQRVYAGWMAGSAARGLLAIGTDAASAAFLDLTLAPDVRCQEAVVRALELSPPPAAFATLARACMRVHERPETAALAAPLAQALAGLRLRLGRETVPDAERRACADGIRALLPELSGNPSVLRASLLAFARVGADADRDSMDAAARRGGLGAEALEELDALWRAAHPRAEHAQAQAEFER